MRRLTTLISFRTFSAKVEKFFLIQLILIPITLSFSCTPKNDDSTPTSNKSSINLITSSYRTLLSRDPDESGLNYYQNLLEEGINIEEINIMIKNSKEYKLKETNKKIVTNTYQKLLKREPDPEGFKHYLNLLRDGLTSNDINQMIMNSDEYKSLNP